MFVVDIGGLISLIIKMIRSLGILSCQRTKARSQKYNNLASDDEAFHIPIKIKKYEKLILI